MSAMAAVDPPLVVPIEDLAGRIGVTADAANSALLTDAILDAQSDVEAYLGRAISPVTLIQAGCYPYADGWRLDSGDEDVLTVLAADAEVDVDTGAPTGLFTVTFTVGLDVVNDPTLRPIRRYVLAHAMNSPEVLRYWKSATKARGDVKTVSAEGQSITWSDATLGGGGDAGSGKPGALPTLASLDRWRLAGRRVYQGRTQTTVWPGQSMLYSSNRDTFERNVPG